MDELLSQLTLEQLFQLYYRLKDAAKRLHAASLNKAMGSRRGKPVKTIVECADEATEIGLAVWREAMRRQTSYRRA